MTETITNAWPVVGRSVVHVWDATKWVDGGAAPINMDPAQRPAARVAGTRSDCFLANLLAFTSFMALKCRNYAGYSSPGSSPNDYEGLSGDNVIQHPIVRVLQRKYRALGGGWAGY